MKNRIINLLLGLLIVIGVGMIAYPSFSNAWNQAHSTQAIAVYNRQLEEIDTSETEEMLDAARIFNDLQNKASNKQLFIEENKETYESLLNLNGSSIMGYIEIPSIDVILPIYHGTSDEVLQVGVGHVDWTSLPVGGEGTHTVLSGHRGLPSAELFTDLDSVNIGDRFSIHILTKVLYYEVDEITVVLPEETETLVPSGNEDLATLVTCTPYGVNSHRLLVRGHRTSPPAYETGEIISDGTYVSMLSVTLITLIVTWIILIMIRIIKKIYRKRKRGKRR